MTFQELAHNINRYFVSNGLSPKHFTVIINVSDRSTAAHIDGSINHEFSQLSFIPNTATHSDLSKPFEVNGVRFKIESPVHSVDC